MIKRRNKGLAEELSWLFYDGSGPALRVVQRRISQPGVWWMFANVFGLILGGLLIIASGLLPWWQVYSNEPAGLELTRGQAAFSLGAALFLMGFVRALRPSDRFRLATVPAGVLMALVVIGLALLERGRANPIEFYYNFLLPYPFVVREGFYLALYGGIIAFLGSLCGLAPDPDPFLDPPPRFSQYSR